MTVSDLPDDDLVDFIQFCRAVMDTDSEVTDVWLDMEDGSRLTYPQLLKEAAKRSG